jgi:anti-anti-sigma factor
LRIPAAAARPFLIIRLICVAMSARQKIRQTGPRLGELLVERKLVSPEAVQHALVLQRTALESERRPPKLGEILVRRKVLSRQTVRLLLDEQKIARGEKRKLEVTVEEPSRGVVLVKLRGGLDKQTDGILVKLLEKLMDRGAYKVAVDCSELVSISSYSVSSIVVYVDECRARGGDLALVGLRSQPKVTLEQLSLMQFLSSFDTKAQAVGALRDSQHAMPTVAEFVSSSPSRHFHFSYCQDLNKLREETKLYFMSREKALRGGKQPCPKCNP